MKNTIANTCGYTDYCNEVLADIAKIQVLRKELSQLEILVNADIEELRTENPEMADCLFNILGGE